MNVKELIEKLSTLPEDAPVRTWSARWDAETSDVVVSVTPNGVVFVLNVAHGKEV